MGWFGSEFKIWPIHGYLMIVIRVFTLSLSSSSSAVCRLSSRRRVEKEFVQSDRSFHEMSFRGTEQVRQSFIEIESVSSTLIKSIWRWMAALSERFRGCLWYLWGYSKARQERKRDDLQNTVKTGCVYGRRRYLNWVHWMWVGLRALIPTWLPPFINCLCT